MKIVHINLFDQYGGAARVANQLMAHSRKQGHTVHQFVFRHAKMDDPYTISMGMPPKDLIEGLIQCEQKAGLMDYLMPCLMSVIFHPIFREADIVHLHCIHGGYFSFLLLPFLAKKKLIWTLHDTTAYTAHCLYPHLCNRWQNDYCSECPREREEKKNRVLFQQVKESIMDITPMTLTAPSRWLKEMAQQSIFRSKDIQLIYNGVDTEIYYPREKAAMREKFNLPKDSFILMFAAHGGLANDMKGGKHMLSVLEVLQKKHKNLVFLHVGSSDDKLTEGLSIPTFTYPYIDDETRMAELYAAADLFVSTSLTESFGLTVCEAMASGTPTVAFSVGGLVEIIEDKKSGWLVPLEDEKAMIKVIVQAVEQKEELADIGINAAARIKERFSLQKCCEAFEGLYAENQ